jgi:hypothetical protein
VRTPYRIVTTLIAAAAVFPFGMSAASADTTQPRVTQGAWYWADKSVVVGPEVLTPPEQLTGVPAGDLAVAFKKDDGNKPDKVAYLAWDVSAIPAGSTVSKFELTIPVETDPKAVQAGPSDLKLVACGAIGDFSPASAGAFSDRPADDCGAAAPGTYDAAKKTWTFDVAPYANAWAHGDPPSGIGILPAPDSAVPFQVVFKGPATVTTTVEFTPPPVVQPTVDVTPPVVQPPVDNGGTGVVGPPPIVPAQATPAPQPAPTAAPPVVSTPVHPVTPVAKGITFPSKSGLPGAFWGGALAAVLLLGVASLMLGDATVAAEAPRGRTVTRSLRERQGAHRGSQPRSQTRVRTV